MTRFTARWLEIADRSYSDLPAETRSAVDQRVAELLEDPYGPTQAYDAATDQWITSYGDGTGLIAYAVAAEQHRVLILRIL